MWIIPLYRGGFEVLTTGGWSCCWKDLIACAEEEVEQLIRRGADAAARLAAATAPDDETQKGSFHALKLVRQLLIADKRCVLVCLSLSR